MKLNKFKLYLYQLMYSQIKHTKIMTQNMRSPGNGFLGNVARELMIIFNGWELPHPKNFIYKLLIEFYLISSKFYQVYQVSS